MISTAPRPLRYSASMAWLKRTLLIWLLVLAVPAQGLAAVTMAMGAGSHAGPGAALALAAASQAPMPGPAAAGSDAGPEPHAASAHCQQLLAGEATDPTASAGAKTHSCSVCSSCCSPGAMPSSLLAVPADAPAATRFAVLVTTLDLVVVDGLERPPRTPPA